MTATELFNLLGQGSAAVLALGIVALVRGWLISKPAHDAQVAILEQQITDGQEREAKLWQILESTAGWTDQAGVLADRSTRQAEALAGALAQVQALLQTSTEAASKTGALPPVPTWAATQAGLEQPRRSRPRKEPPP